MMFYLSGTVDNLTANSSPVQMEEENKTAGLEPDTLAKNKAAYQQLGEINSEILLI